MTSFMSQIVPDSFRMQNPATGSKNCTVTFDCDVLLFPETCCAASLTLERGKFVLHRRACWSSKCPLVQSTVETVTYIPYNSCNSIPVVLVLVYTCCHVLKKGMYLDASCTPQMESMSGMRLEWMYGRSKKL